MPQLCIWNYKTCIYYPTLAECMRKSDAASTKFKNIMVSMIARFEVLWPERFPALRCLCNLRYLWLCAFMHGQSISLASLPLP